MELKADLATQRQARLLDDRRRLVRLLGRLRSAATIREDYEPHDVTDDEATLQADMIETRLRAIDTALERIESGDHAECRICGSTIDPARLEALPATTKCLDCV